MGNGCSCVSLWKIQKKIFPQHAAQKDNKKDNKLQLEFQDFYVKHPVRTIHKPIILYINDILVTLNIGNTFIGTFFPPLTGGTLP